MTRSKPRTCRNCKWSLTKEDTSTIYCEWYGFNWDKLPPIYGISALTQYRVSNLTAEDCYVFKFRTNEDPWDERKKSKATTS